MNQPLAFGALIAGGVLITSAITGRSVADVVTGQVHTLTDAAGTTALDSSVAAAVNGNKAGLVNPFAHAQNLVETRVDMGVDHSMRPGSPILALGDSRVVGTLQNWYSGQPFQWYQLLNEHGGTQPTAARPYAGRYWYLAEQINPLHTPGTVVKAGAPVATFAASGTGVESGWAAGDGRTLAQATGQTGDSSHGNAPAGREWDAFLKALAG